MKATGPLLGLMLGGLATACSPVIRSHGFMPTEESLARVEVGVDSRSTVQRKLGRPSMDGVFNDDGWYYVATTVEHYTYHEPEVIDRRVLAIQFDEIGQVAAINRYGLEDGRIIDLETRTTPTHGRQLTILEQVIGNLGAISGEEFFNQ